MSASVSVDVVDRVPHKNIISSQSRTNKGFARVRKVYRFQFTFCSQSVSRGLIWTEKRRSEMTALILFFTNCTDAWHVCRYVCALKIMQPRKSIHTTGTAVFHSTGVTFLVAHLRSELIFFHSLFCHLFSSCFISLLCTDNRNRLKYRL